VLVISILLEKDFWSISFLDSLFLSKEEFKYKNSKIHTTHQNKVEISYGLNLKSELPKPALKCGYI
jgi:hypothetical protein